MFTLINIKFDSKSILMDGTEFKNASLYAKTDAWGGP